MCFPRPRHPKTIVTALMLTGAGFIGCQSTQEAAPTGRYGVVLRADQAPTEEALLQLTVSAPPARPGEPPRTARWVVSDDERCPTGALDAAGHATCTFRPRPDDTEAFVTVTSADGTTAQAHLLLDVAAAEPPALRWTDLPVTTFSDRDVTLRAQVTDQAHAPTALRIRWFSDRDGPLDLPSRPDANGAATGVLRLSAGIHQLIVTATDPAGAGAIATTTLTVRPPNQPPRCGLLGPLETVLQTDGLALPIAAEDPDDPRERLDIQLVSDRDGRLTVLHPSTDATGWAPNPSTGEHHLRLRVTDPHGGVCTTQASAIVGTPPQGQFEPTTPLQVNTEQQVWLAATVQDAESPAGDISATWTSSIDGTLGSSRADAHGRLKLSVPEMSAGDHLMLLHLVDPDGLWTTQSSWLSVNGRPSAPEIRLSPAAPHTSEKSVVVFDQPSIDPEGEPVAYRYAWTKNGAPARPSNDTLPETETTRGESWTVTVTPFDGLADGPPATASLIVQNSRPAISDVQLSPASPTIADPIHAATVADDPDDDTLRFVYTWTVDGVASTATGGTFYPASLRAGQVVGVSAVAWDDTLESVPMSATGLTIRNSPPTRPRVAITPEAPTVGVDALLCSVITESTDLDNDPIEYFIEWTVDGVDSTDLATSAARAGDTIGAEHLADGQLWECTAIPFDGVSKGAMATDSVSSFRECAVTARLELNGETLIDVELFDTAPDELALRLSGWPVATSEDPNLRFDNLVVSTLAGDVLIDDDFSTDQGWHVATDSQHCNTSGRLGGVLLAAAKWTKFTRAGADLYLDEGLRVEVETVWDDTTRNAAIVLLTATPDASCSSCSVTSCMDDDRWLKASVHRGNEAANIKGEMVDLTSEQLPVSGEVVTIALEIEGTQACFFQDDTGG